MSKVNKKVETGGTKQEKTTYKKEDILKSKRFVDVKDIVGVVILDKEEVSLDEVEKRVNTFLNREVK